ncbi:MAG: hypothetical protein II567_04810, partial [Candidatus Riflebacteria bacterium]|nr:hypothetical protein [Candidatus Riflebacteria bacterium]
MIKIKAIAFYKKRRSGNINWCVLCAILVLLLSVSVARAQEPILITPMQAEDYYESLSIDSEAVSEEEDSNATEVEVVETTDSELSANSVAVYEDSTVVEKIPETANVAEKLKPQKIEEDIPLIEDNEDVEEFFDDEDEDGNILTADTVAIPDAPNVEKVNVNKKDGKPDMPSSQVIRYAKRFWDEAEEEYDKHNIEISGTKTFDMKKSKVSGDISHFSTEHYDCYPGFKMNQSLHLEIDGNIDEKSTVHAVLDDTEDEDRKFTVTIDSNKWKFVLGDFPIALKGSKFALYGKEVRGVMAQGYFHNKVRSTFLYTQSKGLSRREQFRGAGQQQEYRMQVSPIVQESEKVYIDGIQLVRGTDYQIDYEEGIVKFSQSVLPIEMTRWIVVEYESNDEDMAFTRNLFGTRHEYIRSEGRSIGVTWLREFDHSSPKAGAEVDNASGTITPMRHDVYEADIDWKLGKGFSVTGEYAVSKYDPNTKSGNTDEDKEITGHAASFGLNGKTNKIEASASYDKVDSKFKTIGREDGVVELGERGLVD